MQVIIKISHFISICKVLQGLSLPTELPSIMDPNITLDPPAPLLKSYLPPFPCSRRTCFRFSCLNHLKCCKQNNIICRSMPFKFLFWCGMLFPAWLECCGDSPESCNRKCPVIAWIPCSCFFITLCVLVYTPPPSDEFHQHLARAGLASHTKKFKIYCIKILNLYLQPHCCFFFLHFSVG